MFSVSVRKQSSRKGKESGPGLSWWRRHSLLAALVILPLTGCIGGESGPPAEFTEATLVLEEGISELEDGNYSEARDLLEPLVNEDDDLAIALDEDILLKDQARYAYVMADSLAQINEWLNTIADIFIIAADLGAFGAPGSEGLNPAAALEAMGGDGLVAGALDQFLEGFSEFFSDNSLILAKIKSNPEFSLKFKRLPLKFDAFPFEIMDMAGEHDLAEANFLDSVYLLVDGVLKTLLATDFTINFATLPINYLAEEFGRIFNEENAPVVQIIQNTFGVVFATQSALLDLADSPTMKLAGENFGGAFKSLGNAIKFIFDETDDQSDDIVARVEDDDDIYLQVNIDFKNIVVLDIDTLDEIQVLVTEDVINGVDNIAGAFEGQANQRINWARDLVPLIAVVSAALIRSGFVEAMVEAVLAITATDDPELLATLDSVLGSQLISEDLIAGVLLGIIPDVIEFDVGSYFGDPQGALRDWMPFWTLPTDYTTYDTDTVSTNTEVTVTDYRNVRLLMSFECDDNAIAAGATEPTPIDPPLNEDGGQAYLCSVDDAVDLNHFTIELWPEVTTPEFQSRHAKNVNGRLMWENLLEMKIFEGEQTPQSVQPPTTNDDPENFGLAADGTDGLLAIVAFRDPTFSSILYIRLPSDAPEEMAAYKFGQQVFFPATNRSLNALFQQLIANILGLTSL